LAQQIVKKGMSVRQAEALAKRELEANSPENKVKAKNKEASDFAIQSLEKDLTRAIGFKVSIKKTGARSGLLSVEYHDHDQLTVIMRRLTEKS
jgi:ParB family chromosome partitioning protein